MHSSKSNFDSRHGVREVNLTVGQWVRVKSVRKVARGSRKFSIPKQIMKVMNNTLELDDDSIGHMTLAGWRTRRTGLRMIG